jgi:hypothetical protein
LTFFQKSVDILQELWNNTSIKLKRKRNMSYIIDKFNAGEVVVIDGVHGWYFEEGFTGEPEHRPLMADAMGELLDAGLCTELDVILTREAREVNDAKNIAAYIEGQKNRSAEQIAEERFEARAALGAGTKVVNILTGESYYA